MSGFCIIIKLFPEPLHKGNKKGCTAFRKQVPWDELKGLSRAAQSLQGTQEFWWKKISLSVGKVIGIHHSIPTNKAFFATHTPFAMLIPIPSTHAHAVEHYSWGGYQDTSMFSFKCPMKTVLFPSTADRGAFHIPLFYLSLSRNNKASSQTNSIFISLLFRFSNLG